MRGTAKAHACWLGVGLYAYSAALILVALPRPILHRFGDMRRLDLLGAGEIGNGAGQLEDAVVGAGAEMQLAHGCLEQILAGSVKLAVLAHLVGVHLRIGQRGCTLKAFTLALPCRFDAGANRRARFAEAIVGQLFVFDTRNLHVNVNAVK